MIIVHIGPDNLPILHRKGGAIERRILSLAKAQSQMGDRVLVYSIGDVAERRFYHGYEIRSLPCSFPGAVRHFIFLSKCIRDLWREKVDIIHFHSQPEGAFLSNRILAKKILTYDFYKFRYGKRNPFFFLYPFFLKKFDYLLPVSKYCLRESKQYWKISNIKIEVIYNGVDLAQFYPDYEAGQKIKTKLGISKRVVLYVGRVCEQKGTDVLIKAYNLLREQRNDIILVVAGPSYQFGSQKTSVLTEAISQAGGLYLGAVDEDQLAPLYNMAEVFVLPSRELEMFGMVAVEAQACGKPVVASDHGGLKEVIAAGSGFRFPVGDFVSLAKKINLLLDNPELSRSISAAARINALKFNWTSIAADLRKVYVRSLMNDSSSLTDH